MAKKRCFLIFVFFPFTSILAQHDVIQSGPVSLACGNALVAQSNVWSAFNNPSAACFDSNSGYGISYENRFKIQGLSRGTIALNFLKEKSAITVAMSYFGSSIYNDARFAVGFNQKLDKNISAGIQLNYLHTQIKSYGYASIVVPELSLFFMPNKKLSLGVHVFNPLGNSFKENISSNIISLMDIGINYQLSHYVSFLLAYSISNHYKGKLKTGMQYQMAENLKIFLGVDTKPAMFSFGADWMINKKMNLQIAAQFHSYLGYHISPGFIGGF